MTTGFETIILESSTDSAQQAQLFQAFIQPLRFLNDESGYCFIESYKAWMVAHATVVEGFLSQTNTQKLYSEPLD